MKAKIILRLSIGAALLFTAAIGTAGAEGQASVYFGRSGIDVLPITNFSTYGGSVGVFAGPVGAEFALEHSPLGGIDLGPLALGASMTNVMGNLVVQIPLGNFQPYGTVGYGALIGRAGLAPFFGTGETVGAVNYGFGGKIFVSRHVGVRLDYRRFAVQGGDALSDVNIPFTGTGVDIDPDVDRFMGGVMFRF